MRPKIVESWSAAFFFVCQLTPERFWHLMPEAKPIRLIGKTMKIERFDEPSQRRALVLMLDACPQPLPYTSLKKEMAGADAAFNLFYLASAGLCSTMSDPTGDDLGYLITARGIDLLRST